VTTATLRERGVRIDVTATEYTIEGLLDALEAFAIGPPRSD
jgi:uroporphyrinogen-III synthase